MSGGTLQITTLTRREGVPDAAAAAARRLIHVVGEWPIGASLSVVMRAARKGRVVVQLTASAPVQPTWADDITWALNPIADVKVAAALPNRQPATVGELRANREVRPAPESHDGDRDRRAAAPRAIPPWPAPVFTDLIDLLDILANDTDLAVTMVLGPANPLEYQIIEDTLRETWSGADAALYDYLGTPIRLRTLVGSTGPLPARLRAIVRRWGTGISVVELRHQAARAAWFATGSDLAGHVVPEGMALGLVRLPAAGGRSVPGMSTAAPKARVVAIDPVPPRPTAPVRLGRARTSSNSSVEVALDISDLMRHASIDGASGAGKSTMVAALCHGIIERGYGLTLFDPHGTGVTSVVEQAPAHSLERISIVRHGDREHPVGLNILGAEGDDLDRAIDTFVELVQRIYDPRGENVVGPRWRRWMSLLAHGTKALMGERASLPAVVAIATDQRRIRSLAERLKGMHPELAHRITNEIGNLDGKEANELISWAVSKLNPLVSTGAMRGILGTGANSVDVGAVMRDSGALLIDLASTDLGVPGARTLGALWLMQHWLEMGKRGPDSRPHVIIVDEAHLVQWGALPNILAEGRKFNLGVVVATQHNGQLSAELAESLESNAGSFISLRSGLKYSARASLRMDGWPAADLARLPDLRAAAVISRAGVQSDPFTLDIDHHARMRRGTTPTSRAAQLANATIASRRALWEPHSHLKPITDAEVERALMVTRPRVRLREFDPPEIVDWRERRAEELEAADTLDGF